MSEGWARIHLSWNLLCCGWVGVRKHPLWEIRAQRLVGPCRSRMPCVLNHWMRSMQFTWRSKCYFGNLKCATGTSAHLKWWVRASESLLVTVLDQVSPNSNYNISNIIKTWIFINPQVNTASTIYTSYKFLWTERGILVNWWCWHVLCLWRMYSPEKKPIG